MMILQIMVLLKSDGKLHGGCSGRFKKNYSILSNGWITVRNIHGRLTRTAHYKVAVGSRFREDLNERSDYPLGALNVFFAYTKTQGQVVRSPIRIYPKLNCLISNLYVRKNCFYPLSSNQSSNYILTDNTPLLIFLGTTCPTIPNPKNGLASKLGLFLQLRCNTDYFFNPYPPGLPGLFQNPFYRCIDNKWVSQNDFVSILHQAPDCMSKFAQYFIV